MLDFKEAFEFDSAFLFILNLDLVARFSELFLCLGSDHVLHIEVLHFEEGTIFLHMLLLNEFLVFPEIELFEGTAQLIQVNPEINEHVVGHLLNDELLLLLQDLGRRHELLVLQSLDHLELLLGTVLKTIKRVLPRALKVTVLLNVQRLNLSLGLLHLSRELLGFGNRSNSLAEILTVEFQMLARRIRHRH